MKQFEFKVKVGDVVIFLDNDNDCFEKNGKYKVLTINKYGEYPFNEAHQIELANNLKEPKVFTIKDKNGDTFILLYTNDGFANNFDNKCNFKIFDFERRLRKLKLYEIENNNEINESKKK